MAAINLNTFAGEVPRVSERLLGNNNAVIARNTDLSSGELRGFRDFSIVTEIESPADAKAVFRVYDPPDDDIWMAFTNIEAKFVKGQVLGDVYNRYYWSGDGTKLRFAPKDDLLTGPTYVLGVFGPTVSVNVAVDIEPSFPVIVSFLRVYDHLTTPPNADYSYYEITTETPHRLSVGSEIIITDASDPLVNSAISAGETIPNRVRLVVDTEENGDLSKSTKFQLFYDWRNNSYTPADAVITGATITYVEAPVELQESRVYTYTYVNIFSEESAPAPPSAVTTGMVKGTWTISNIEFPEANVDYAPINKIRLYRTISGAASSEYYLVTEIDVPVIPLPYPIVNASDGLSLVNNIDSDDFNSLGYYGALGFRRTTGSFLTEQFGYAKTIQSSGFANALNNGIWEINLYGYAQEVNATEILVPTWTDGPNQDFTDTVPATTTGPNAAAQIQLHSLNDLEYADILPSDVVVLNSILSSDIWEPPPDNLKGLTALPNGMMVAFKDNELWFSEPYHPHAWPAVYTLTIKDNIIGIAPFNNQLAVITDSMPYVGTGVNPAVFTLARLDAIEPCVSSTSITSNNSAVFYASSNGIIAISPNGIQNITNQLIDKYVWEREYLPEHIKATQLGNSYIAFNSSDHGFILGLDEPLGKIVSLDAFTGVENVQTDINNGKVYAVIENRVYEWNPSFGILIPYVWKSKKFTFTKPLNLAAAKVMVESNTIGISPAVLIEFNEERFQTPLAPINSAPINGVVLRDLVSLIPQNSAAINGSPLYLVVAEDSHFTFTVFADNRNIGSWNREDNDIIRLPSGFKAKTWQFEVRSRAIISQVEIAETGKELMNV